MQIIKNVTFTQMLKSNNKRKRTSTSIVLTPQIKEQIMNLTNFSII